MALEEIVEHCQNLYDDLDFSSVIRWKNAASGRKVIGHMPVYVPRELIHAESNWPLPAGSMCSTVCFFQVLAT